MSAPSFGCAIFPSVCSSGSERSKTISRLLPLLCPKVPHLLQLILLLLLFLLLVLLLMLLLLLPLLLGALLLLLLLRANNVARAACPRFVVFCHAPYGLLLLLCNSLGPQRAFTRASLAICIIHGLLTAQSLLRLLVSVERVSSVHSRRRFTRAQQ